MENKEKTIDALKKAISAAEQCEYAFNHLAVVTDVHFFKVDTALYDVLPIVKGWLEKLEH